MSLIKSWNLNICLFLRSEQECRGDERVEGSSEEDVFEGSLTMETIVSVASGVVSPVEK